MVLSASYDYALVALSVIIAVLASYAALDLAGRVTSARGQARLLWLSGGAYGHGVRAFWSNALHRHAWPPPARTRCATTGPRSCFRWLAAILASAGSVCGEPPPDGPAEGLPWQPSDGRRFIAAMHYIGMAAMRLPAICSYSTSLFLLSVVLAVVISFVALWLTFYFRTETTVWRPPARHQRLGDGAAIPVMHYTGMAAARFTPSTASESESVARRQRLPPSAFAGSVSSPCWFWGLVLLTRWPTADSPLQSLELESSRRHHQII